MNSLYERLKLYQDLPKEKSLLYTCSKINSYGVKIVELKKSNLKVKPWSLGREVGSAEIKKYKCMYVLQNLLMDLKVIPVVQN